MKYKIPVYYRYQGKYKIMETVYFGYRLSISTKIKPVREQDGNFYLYYDPTKAILFNNDKNYVNLYIEE